MLQDRAILIVEDEPMIAMMLEDLLTDLGCRVVGAALDLVQAQMLFDKHGCDAAIIDLNLNGILAHGFIATLRERGVPVIVATGYGSAFELPSGCLLLSKPYAMQHVEQALRASFDG